MIQFFRSQNGSVIAAQMATTPSTDTLNKLCWLFGNAECLDAPSLPSPHVGPRREMITPWSTNAVEITQNMGISGISRIEEYFPVSGPEADYDPMLQRF